jgi:hypothetical protein
VYSSPDAATSRRIGRYLLQEELGRGGMGVVYAALDEGLGRRVALKLLRPGGPDDDAARGERFEQEMQIAISLEHPNIVPVHETGTEDGVRYIAMRLVDGEDLGAVIRREGALDPARVARLGRQIASALDAAHARGLVHRDVKPGNVLLTGSGDEEHAYLTDFGLTRDADGGLTQTGQWIGTVDYAAPEQIEAAPLSARTDIYSLGCVFYHALTGALPYTGSFAAKATAHVTAPLPSVEPSVPRHGARLDRVLAVATAKDPQRRHASAGALARAVARVITAAEQDATQRTAAMPVLFPDDDAVPTSVQDTRATAVQPREPRPAAVPVPPRPRRRASPAPVPVPGVPDVPDVPAQDAAPAGVAAVPPDGLAGDRNAPSRTPWVAAGLLVALAVVAVMALAVGGGNDEASRKAADTTTTTSSGGAKAKTTAKTGRSAQKAATTTPRPAAPAPAVIPTAAYTAPAGGYTARVPAGKGWTNTGERDLNGVIRTIFTGPAGEQLWIDATPTLAPTFGREGRTVTEVKRLDGPLGPIVGYRFTGAPAEFCGGGCVDYQVDLGGRGFAVMAGPTSSARLAARTTMLSLQQTAPPAATSPAAAGHQTPAAAQDKGFGKRFKGNGKRGDDGDDE